MLEVRNPMISSEDLLIFIAISHLNECCARNKKLRMKRSFHTKTDLGFFFSRAQSPWHPRAGIGLFVFQGRVL